MTQIKLKKLLRKNKPLTAVIEMLVQSFDVPATIQDEDGTILAGRPLPAQTSPIPIEYDGEIIGWVGGQSPQADMIAELLELLLEKEGEKRALAGDLLDKYRELNLLYTLSERLLAEPDPQAIADLALAEASRLIQATAGWVMIWDEGTAVPLTTSGSTLEFKPKISPEDDIVAHVLETREAEIRNRVPTFKIFTNREIKHCALLCAPLKTEQHVLGSILLVAADPIAYEAHDLKLLNTVALQVAPVIEMARLYQIAVEKGRLERELQLAYDVQASLIPAETPQIGGWDFAGRWKPARELSGDYYDFIPEAEGQLGLVIGDVADKGMPSALFMVHTRAAVRTAVAQPQTPAEAITQANQLVTEESHNGLFVTLVYGRLQPVTGQLILINAGHNPAYHFQAASSALNELTRTGIPLGIMEDCQYRQHTIQLESGDFVVFYTDGVTEAMNESDEEFGPGRLMTTIRSNQQASAADLVSAIEKAVNDFARGTPPFDDFTLLVLRRQ